MKLSLRFLASWLLICPPAFAETNAIARGLSWLASQQHADGSWSTNVALNSLSVLAFLSAGRVDDPVVERGLRFVLSQQATNGEFTANGAMMYGHGITTLLLAECVGLTKQEVRTPLARAVELTLRAQAIEKSALHAGGWRYEATSNDSDLSVTVWQIIALKAASDVGIKVPRIAMERALAYVKHCEHPQGGFGYQPGGLPNQSRTAAATIALRMCGEKPDTNWLERNPLRWESPFFYHAAHYCAHVSLNETLVVEHQNADGSWPPPPNSKDEEKAGPIYRTAMAVLALTAKWNYLPAFLQ